MNSFSQVPPGFRFHPTDEELVDYYLRKKIASRRIDLDVIKDIDLYKIEPWDLQEKCKIGTEEQNEWYFFSHKDKKYPTGTRTNRATTAGFWKATGRDKAIYSKHNLIGMRKTLVFYKGRAPNGQKSDWIMHEYRLETNENGTPQEEGWVVCRVFKKRMTAIQRASEHGSPSWCDDQLSFMPESDSPKRLHPADHGGYHQEFSCKPELDLHKYVTPHHENYFQLPHLESPKPPTSATTVSCNSLSAYALDINHGSNLQSSSLTQEGNIQNNHRGHELISPFYSNASEQAVDQVTDWRVLHKFVASQLSQDEVSKEPCNYSSSTHHVLQASENLQLLIRQTDKPDAAAEYASTSTSSCQIDPWK